MTSTSAQPAQHRAISRRSLMVAALSTVVEWYEFTLFLYLAPVLARVFFQTAADGLNLALQGFALAYLFRPVGALLMGRWGDRRGRRQVLTFSMGLMSLSMWLTVLLPTAAQAGALGGMLLLLLRCAMSFAVGGEYSGVVVYLLEGAPPKRRGLVASLAAAASEMGGLMAAAICSGVVRLLPQPALDSWGWRVPFALGALLATALWWARGKMDESPEFLGQRARKTLPTAPLRHNLTHHRRTIATGFAISAVGSVTYYLGLTYTPTFLATHKNLREADAYAWSTFAAAVAIVVSPGVGALSDRVGRKRLLLVLWALTAVLPTLTFGALLRGGTTGMLFGVATLALLAGAISALGAVATAEQLPGPGRMSGLALGSSTATALFGGFSPWLAHALETRLALPIAPALCMSATALLTLPLLWQMDDKRPTP